MRTMAARMTVAALAMGIALCGTRAEAQDRPRDFFVGGGLGFAVGFEGGAFFRLEEDVGYHVLHAGEHPGLYVVGTFVQDIGNAAALAFSARAGFDVLLWHNDDLAIVLNPSLALGVGVLVGGPEAAAAFFLHPGVEGAVVLLDGLLSLWWRPLGFDVFIRDGGFGAYTMTFGANVNL